MPDKILVLEDDLSLMEGIRDMLELQGYTVMTAVNGVEGLKVMNAAATPPDLIVSDIMMPEMDGYAFLEHIRKNEAWEDIPFIFLTAKGEKQDMREGRMSGADEYMVKPFEAEDLIVVIASKLKRHRQLQRLKDKQIGLIKRRILTILHHEFRTPLTYVVAYADLLNADIAGMSAADLKEFLGGINAGAGRLRRLIENFILLVELETGEAANTFAWRKRPITHFGELMAAILSQVATCAEEHGVTLRMGEVPDPSVAVIGDQEYLKTALTRLLDNAIKFTEKNSAKPVTLSARHEGDKMNISIADEGRGIPEAEIPHIFEMFYQINREATEDQGAGAGLAIVRRIVDLHGGSINVKSIVGQGSVFTISLPVSAPQS